MARKATINMVAECAGVSRGTVDRVLNSRPHVKPEIEEKVLRAMHELHYVPPKPEQAAALGLSATVVDLPPCKLGVLLTNEGGYLRRELLRGIENAESLLRDYGVEIVVQKCETDLPDESVERLNCLADEGINGIAMCAKDHISITRRVNELTKQGIAVVTMNTDLTGCDRLCFIGQDLVRGGRVAGELLAKYITPDDNLLIAIGNPEFNAHRLRLQGFCERIYERGFNGGRLQMIETYNDYTLSYQKVREAIERVPDIRGIYMANHSVTGCVEAVRDMGLSGKVHIVSHDLTDSTRRLLKSGEIDFTIAQNIYQQSYQALMTLREYVQRHTLPRTEQHAPIEIVCAENL